MSLGEVAWRVHDDIRRQTWALRQARPGALPGARRPRAGQGFTSAVPPSARSTVPAGVPEGLVAAAAPLLEGRGEFLGVWRTDLAVPDWYLDPITGRRAPQDKRSFRINTRSEAETGNIKQVWELSRLQHLTLLAATWFVTGDDAYPAVVADQLRSWWRENPFLYGVNWTSGIEVGIRLISLVWIRRLLDAWPGAPALFEHNDAAMDQVYWHQRYLAALQSRGSSANNHVIAEAAGQLIASCAFPWFEQSERWRAGSATLLERELRRNTFPSGMNREQASDYQGFVAELGMLAAVEADLSGHPLSADTWQLLCSSVDATAAVLDESERAPRQGDSDEGRALLVDPPGTIRWASLLATGASLFGSAPWWPTTHATLMSTLLTSLTDRPPIVRDRARERPSHFADAGLTLLRTEPDRDPEIWCRCDAGPHGYGSLAAHAHADALSIEVRCGGVDILADPGTYCYHGEPEWRRYFRSTLGHNTVELATQDQSLSGGPFLWLRHAVTSAAVVERGEDRTIQHWSAEHYGYEVLNPPARHRRSVRLDSDTRRIDVEDHIGTIGYHAVRMTFHLGPAVSAELGEGIAQLRWPVRTRIGYESATMALPGSLHWSMHRGEYHPILGWYSDRFGVKEPTTTLLGEGHCNGEVLELRSSIQFAR
ncbi:MAG: alginate lyase family protein [Acidimicrobiales bacterium]